MKIKALFLDFYGTLVHEDDEIIPIICNKIRNSSSHETTNDEIAKFWWGKFYELFSNSFGKNFKTQRELEQISIELTLKHFNSNENESELSQLLYNHWQRPKLHNETLEFMRKLKIETCVVSNIDRQDINAAIDFHGLYFRKIFTSEDAKSYKPRSELFELALKEMGYNREEVLHIGDSVNSDITGAKNAGIKAVWINRKNRDVNKELVEYSCNNLLQIDEIIEKIASGK